MKTRLFAILAVAALFAGCAKEIETTTPGLSGKRQVTITGDIQKTKTTVTDAGIYSWSSNEQIAVAEQDMLGSTPILFDLQDAETGSFAGTLSSDKEPVFAISPAFVASEFTEMDGDILYTITFDDVDDYVPGTTNALMVAGNPQKNGNNYTFEFRHAAAVIKVPVVNVPVGTAKVKLTMDQNITGFWESLTSVYPIPVIDACVAGDPFVSLTLKEAVTAPNTSADFYFAVPVNTYHSFQFELLDADGNRLKGVKKEGLNIALEAADLFITPTLTLPEVECFVKVSSDDKLMNGKYLIVYEGDDIHNAAAFNGAADPLDANNNNITVSINNNLIVATDELKASAFIISIDDSTVKTAGGTYIGASSNSNSLGTSDNSALYKNAISINAGNAIIAPVFNGSDRALRYNYASNTLRFRFYAATAQQPVALYLLNDGSATSPKENPEISYADEDKVKNITSSDPFTAPSLINPHNLDVTYSSSNTSVATVIPDGDGEGTVTVLSAGVTTITASFAGNDSYKAGSASYTLTVAPALEVVTVAQFLTKDVSTTAWYQLTGKLTNIDGTNGAKYGNFTLVDATGSVYVYGLTKTQQASNDQSFGSIGLKEGDIVTINTLRSEHSGTAQAGGSIPAYYVSHIPAPVISVNPSSKTILAAGDNFNVTVTSNCAWTISGDGFTASPSTGNSGETEVAITVPARTVTGDGSITVTITANDDSNVTATVDITQHGTDYTAPAGWIETALSEIAAGDVFVIVGNNGSNYAMSNNNGTGSAPTAVAVTVTDSKITSTVANNIKWNLTVSNGSYTFYPNGSTTTWLYCTNTNNGVRVGTGDAKAFTLTSNGYLTTTQTNDQRYIGVYNSSDWRCYTSEGGNIANQSFTFYKYFDDGKKDAGISYSPTSDTITEGDNLTQPTLNNPNGLTVSYESNNTAVATVNNDSSSSDFGKITVVGVGTAVITASWSEQTIGSETYRADSATFTLTVNEDTSGSEVPEKVVYDFTGSDWSVSGGTLTDGTVSFTGAGSSDGNFKMNSGYFFLGKANAYIDFPTYSYKVTKIVVTGRSGASTAVVQNIYVGDTAVSTATTGATGTNTYNIGASYQAAGTTYTLKVTSSHNTQITKIEVYFGK